MIDTIVFFGKHTPFWGVAFLIVGLELTFILWRKKKKRAASFFLFFALFGLFSTVGFYWLGGPLGVRSFLLEHFG